MHARSARSIVLVRAVLQDRLGEALDAVVGGWPPEAVVTMLVEPDASSAEPLVDLIASVSSAAYLIVQESLLPPSAIHIAAVAAARTTGTPLLLVSPTNRAITPLMRLGDIPPSSVVFYPTTREAEEEWGRLEDDLRRKRQEIEDRLVLADRIEQLAPITARLQHNADVLREAAPPEDVAVTIARVFDIHMSSVQLESHVDFIQLDFPAELYASLLRHLTHAFKHVRTIADPVNEELPWNNPESTESLSAVSERVYALDAEHALQFGIEGALSQLHAAMQAGGAVSVIGLSDDLRKELLLVSPVNQSLRGINRFYAGDSIVGGYSDESASTIRMLAFHSSRHNRAVYDRELALLAQIDSRKKAPPQDRADDATSLASWLYTNVFTPEPDLYAIFDRKSNEYATEYDGNIVRVTPGYYGQLDNLVLEAKRALAALYSPYSGRERKRLRVLELGFGTGTLTGRLMRVCADLVTSIWSSDEIRHERSFIELDGWDSNSKMVEIASQRLDRAAREARDRIIRPSLHVREFLPTVRGTLESNASQYDLVIGSLFCHYWMDYRPQEPVTEIESLREFTKFLGTIKRDFLAPGGIGMFLDVFYSDDSRQQEMTHWRRYVQRELGSRQAAETYFRNNPWQWFAASQSLVTTAARDVGMNVWWRDALTGYPFRILILTDPADE
jgi:SAM-dependent methyltransferase